MKKLLFSLFSIALLTGCTAESLDDYEKYNVDKTKIQRPGSQGIHLEEVEDNKV